ncbi:MAG: phenylalanine--tRNA ligase subunit beta [Spongiibacteraceae bacterium]
MKFNEQWLREWVSPSVSVNELSAQLTMAGLEVDAIDSAAAVFSGVVVGEILEVQQHPDAYKLRVCRVSNGAEAFQVVCGAANARVGVKVPFARIGAVLPNVTIKQAKLRGVESFGMLCGASELGLVDEIDGLWELPADAQVGADVRALFQLDDRIFEIGLTPNRADCLSVSGIAREVGVLNQLTVIAPAINAVEPTITDVLPVTIEATAECPRYVGRVIRNVDLTRPAPLWLRERLRRCGIRSIDSVVDVTNYVMLELGQPMHAFDLGRLQGGIQVRLAKAGETLEALDGQTLELRAGSLVIADHSRPLALAGVMGGRPSAVSAETRNIFLESAFFAPELIAGRARSYGLHTESSHRFERGVDYTLQNRAIARATQLILEIVGGAAGPVVEQVTAELPIAGRITLREASISRMLDIELPAVTIEEILIGLGMAIERVADGWLVVPPSWRFDITIETDLLEELARIYGYNRLPVRSIRADLPLTPKPEQKLPLGSVRRALLARGYQEAITYSFVDPKMQALLAPGQAVVELRNPISSDMSVMRTTLWAGLLNTAIHNLNRQQSRIRLFETGLRFIPGADGLVQEPMLAMLVTGSRHPESWSGSTDAVDFYDLKGDLEAVLDLARVRGAIELVRGSDPALHPGQCAEIRRGGSAVGRIGALHPELQRQFDIQQSVFLAEIALSALDDGPLHRFAELSRFPAVRRDIAVVVRRDVLAQELQSAVRGAAGRSLSDLTLFDVYQGKGIDPERKSLALGLTFQDSSRTLTEDEVNAAIEAVLGALAERFGATLRN